MGNYSDIMRLLSSIHDILAKCNNLKVRHSLSDRVILIVCADDTVLLYDNVDSL